jgi:hypothetical protein
MARRILGFSGLCITIAALGLTACAGGAEKPRQESATSVAVDKTRAGLGDAALSPLNDLNVRKEEIPARLGAIVSPYEPVKEHNCIGIGVEVLELTNILGPDADTPTDPNSAQKRGDAAANLALGQVSSTMSDFIPFRSLVRMATGASAHDRRLRAAYERGQLRRSYLKGLGAQLGCAPPAAPNPDAGAPPPVPQIEYRSEVQPPPERVSPPSP